MQLRQDQESAKAHFTAVVSERDKLKSEVGHHEAREAELRSQLEEKEKQIFHHQQISLAQHQKLRDIAAFAYVRVIQPGIVRTQLQSVWPYGLRSPR